MAPTRDPNHLTCILPMFRCSAVTAEVIEAIARCELPEGYRMTLVVVDDASSDGSAEAIESMAPLFVKVVRNPVNLGRSRTRNIGGGIASPGYLLFLDGDCIPADRQFLRVHLKAMEAGYDLSIGSITGIGGDFWHRYQDEVAARRAGIAALEGPAHAATSQNFMIRQNAFIQLSGFDEGYEGYGFEDRDFFLRAEALGFNMAWCAAAIAIHADRLDLANVCRKMREAGAGPAARFAAAHPDVYASLAYAAFDARRHPWLRYLRPLTSFAARCMVSLIGRRLDSKVLPFTWRAMVVRLVIAANFLDGSCETRR